MIFLSSSSVVLWDEKLCRNKAFRKLVKGETPRSAEYWMSNAIPTVIPNCRFTNVFELSGVLYRMCDELWTNDAEKKNIKLFMSNFLRQATESGLLQTLLWISSVVQKCKRLFQNGFRKQRWSGSVKVLFLMTDSAAIVVVAGSGSTSELMKVANNTIDFSNLGERM